MPQVSHLSLLSLILLKRILFVLLFFLPTLVFADGIFSTTYGEKWVTIVPKSNCGYYLSYRSYSGIDQVCFISTDPIELSDAEKWCLVGTTDNFQLYNKAKGENSIIEVPSSVSDNAFISFTSSNTNHLILTSNGSYYTISPNGTNEYWNLLGGGITSAAGWNSHIGYWNVGDEDNSLWVIEEYTGIPICLSDKGSSVSKAGYSLVFSSENSDVASQYLTLTEDEKSNCSDSFSDRNSLEQTWEYCPRYSAAWNMRMGSNLAEKRQNIDYKNDVLKLYAKTVTSASSGKSKFITSGVQSIKAYKYGIIEIKAKTNAQSGNFPALWFMPDGFRKGTDSSWPVCGEIDLMEMVNNSYTAHGTVHNALCVCNGGSSNFTSSTPADGNYHIYTLKWTSDALTWYIDGTQFYQYAKDSSLSGTDLTNQYPFDKPYYIILNQSCGNGGWAANPDTTCTYEMDVAYVRVYQSQTTNQYLHLSDDDPTIIEGVYKAGNITYTRTSNTYYSGFCVPFDVDLSTMTDNFQSVYVPVDSVIYNPATYVLTTLYYKYDMSSVLPANTPFLAVMTTDENGVKKNHTVFLTSATQTVVSSTIDPTPVTARVYDVEADGTLSISTSYSVKYGGSLNKSAHTLGEGYYIPSGVTGIWGAITSLRAFREYAKILPLTSSSLTPAFSIELLDAPVSIGTPKIHSASSGMIYDLTGRPISTQYLKPGIYIQNGKKFIFH